MAEGWSRVKYENGRIFFILLFFLLLSYVGTIKIKIIKLFELDENI